jgi:hypothetical protein
MATKIQINDQYSTYGFTDENTSGFSDDEIEEMNIELFRRLKSDEMTGIDDAEREIQISQEILNRY